MVAISVNLDDDLMNQIRDRAKSLGINEESLVVKAIQEYLFLNKVDAIREKMGEHFRNIGIQSEEDIYESVS